MKPVELAEPKEFYPVRPWGPAEWPVYFPDIALLNGTINTRKGSGLFIGREITDDAPAEGPDFD